MVDISGEARAQDAKRTLHAAHTPFGTLPAGHDSTGALDEPDKSTVRQYVGGARLLDESKGLDQTAVAKVGVEGTVGCDLGSLKSIYVGEGQCRLEEGVGWYLG